MPRTNSNGLGKGVYMYTHLYKELKQIQQNIHNSIQGKGIQCSLYNFSKDFGYFKIKS